MKIHNVFHVSLLAKHKADTIPGRAQVPAPPVEVEGEEEWEVEEILDAKLYGRWKKLRFLVRWKGYGAEHDEWVQAEDLHAAEIEQQFYNAHPDAPARVATILTKDAEEAWEVGATLRWNGQRFIKAPSRR